MTTAAVVPDDSPMRSLSTKSLVFSVALAQEDIQKLYKDGLYFAVLAVDPADKMTTTWADVKVKY